MRFKGSKLTKLLKIIAARTYLSQIGHKLKDVLRAMLQSTSLVNRVSLRANALNRRTSLYRFWTPGPKVTR